MSLKSSDSNPALVSTGQRDLSVSFITGIYSTTDAVVNGELNRLRVEDNVVPSCKKGCYFCCSQHIITNTIEVKALVHYIKRHFTSRQVEELRIRTVEWHQWDRARRGSPSPGDISDQCDGSGNQFCPMLVDGICSAYDARPMICRRFFVNSNPLGCLLSPLTGVKRHNVNVLSSVIFMTREFETRVKSYIENLEMDYHQSIALLPNRLADEMNWDVS